MMNIEFMVQIWKEGKQYIAHALPLDVASSGKTPEKARQALDEAIRLFFKTAHQHGTLREVLDDCGYGKKVGEKISSPDWVAIERHTAMV